MVYLIHFKSKLKHAAHYIGFTDRKSVKKRINQHRKGIGARLLSVLNQNNIEWELARTWPEGDRNFERSLKNTKNTKHYCPLCNNGQSRIYTPKKK